MIPSDLAGVPEGAEAPAIIAALRGGDQAEAVWLNGHGGLTFRLPGRHAKWQRGGSVDLGREAERSSPVEWCNARVIDRAGVG
ncbi:MAG: hypothetical protein ACTH7O_04960, partial [Microbacterium gubbeenense]